ncbi:protein containing Protein of unknown function DUF1819, putative inner membrane [Candidatus Magnetomorum sp. HK-1]|nr:protein containing Protein of unknown function DUF1819, putative inner membrane [Candidatus Magnetomorum sp. HK-1]
MVILLIHLIYDKKIFKNMMPIQPHFKVKNMNTTHYKMSFTAGALLCNDSIKIADLFLASGSWKDVKTKAVNDNILQSRTINSSKRLSTEICSRLKLLNKNELQVLSKGTSKEQALILWLAACRKYRFIYEFAVEVIREKFFKLQYELTYSDYDSFFNSKALLDEKLDHLANSTKEKLRQIVFKMLREAGLLSSNNIINQVILSPIIIKAINSNSHQDFRLFPVHEADLIDWLK